MTLWGYDRSPEPSASARRAGRRRVPDFFIVGHPKSGTTALYEMLRRHPQIFMPELKEPCFFARGPARALPAAATGAPPRRSRSTSRCSRRARPDQLVGRGLAVLPALADAAASEIAAGCARTRASSRSCASPRASCARCTCSSLQTHVETEHDLARALALEAAGARAAAPAALALAAAAALLRPRPLRRAAAPLPRRVPARAGARADLRRLPRRQRRRPCGRCCASSASTRPSPVEAEGREPDGRRHALAARSTNSCTRSRVGEGPVVARREGRRSRRSRRASCAASALRATQRHVVYGAPPAAGRAADARAAPPLQAARSRRSASTSDRDLVTLWGYDRLD